MKIKEHKSKLPNIMPVKEKMSVFIPDIDKNIPNREWCDNCYAWVRWCGKNIIITIII
jgi:hypothetical protein